MQCTYIIKMIQKNYIFQEQLKMLLWHILDLKHKILQVFMDQIIRIQHNQIFVNIKTFKDKKHIGHIQILIHH